MTGTEQERYADKIAKLLRKAESTDSPEEAEAFYAKAQELMTTYAIDEALLSQARGEVNKQREEIVQDTITYKGVYSRALFDIGNAIARANDVRVLISKTGSSTTIHLIGFESDVANTKLLDASMQLQASRAMTNWARANIPAWMSAMDKYKERRTFLFGFAGGLGQQLTQAKDAGRAQAVRNQTERVNGTEAEASASVELVVRTKREQVNDWMDEHYGKLRSGRGGNYSSGSGSARGAGHSAGSTADVGRPRVGGRKAIGS